MIDAYDWAGGREAMLRFGPADGPVVIAALPLFDEANRTRAFTVAILHALAARGVAGALPDLPGAGESLIPTHAATLADWRRAFAAAADYAAGGRPAFALAIRGGALVDGEARVHGRWHFSPMSGADALRELVRIRQASAREAGEPFDPAALPGTPDQPPVEIAGNPVSRTLLAELAAAVPETVGTRIVRLESDARIADAKLPGTPLWRRAEPDTDSALAELIAADIAEWIDRCAA